jgi:hypothetical protein
METLLTVIPIGICMIVVVAMHLHLTARPPEPVDKPPTDDIDSQFLRIIGREFADKFNTGAQGSTLPRTE